MTADFSLFRLLYNNERKIQPRKFCVPRYNAVAYFGIGIPDRIVGLSNTNGIILREKGAMERYGKH